MSEFSKPELLLGLVKLCAAGGLTYLTITYLMNKLDPTNNKQKLVAQHKGKTQLERIGKPKVSFIPFLDMIQPSFTCNEYSGVIWFQLQLTEHELLIASHLITPDDINISWSDIAGLKDVVTEIFETVIFPIRKRSQLTSKLTTPPKGVLLHGPPGCGKTMIAKATAKEAATSFISLDISMLTDKWYGESQKMVAALFSLAEKLEPCIIFIDEIGKKTA